MPESAEVKLTTEYLSKNLVDKEIISWYFTKEKEPKEFSSSLPAMVEDVQCKGKLIYITLYTADKRFFIIHHMMLSGEWTTRKSNHRWHVTTHDSESIFFNDPLNLATLKLTDDEKELDIELNKLGPDILTDNFKLIDWKDAVAKYKKRNITAFLMDQSIFSGCGNYIKAEVLYYAGVSPLRKMETLNESEITMLFEGLRLIPRIMYNEESYQFKIYKQKFAKRTKTPDGRITYWDPKRQK